MVKFGKANLEIFVEPVKRTRNHRRKNCGSCENITLAHYYLTSAPHDVIEKLKLLDKLKIPVEPIYGKHVFIFKDDSLLAFDEKNGFHKVDTLLRKSRRRLA